MMFLACCYNDPDMLIDPDTIYPTRADCPEAPKSRFKPQACNRFPLIPHSSYLVPALLPLLSPSGAV
jgi:hypothetical protein